MLEHGMSQVCVHSRKEQHLHTQGGLDLVDTSMPHNCTRQQQPGDLAQHIAKEAEEDRGACGRNSSPTSCSP